MDKLRKLQLTELNILKYFISFCEKNNLNYYMLGGTFLGAVRHKGFIPWDDDIDIGMPRDDYEKFIELILNDKNSKYKLDNYKFNKDSLIYITRLEDDSFKIKDKSAKDEKVRNAWIDIFPLDGMPNNFFVRQLHKISLLYSRLMFKYSIFNKFVNQRLKGRPFYERILIKFGQVFNIEKKLSKIKCLNKLDYKLKKYKYKDSKYIVNFMGAYKFKEMFSIDLYKEVEKYDFEDIKLNAPKDYNFILTQLYGDYMKEPEDKNHHYTEIN